MEAKKVRKLIVDWHFDFNNLHADWERGKIDNKEMLKFMSNLCFSFLRRATDSFLESILS